MRAPSAMPTAQLKPCPREPVVMSMPGVRFMSQWLGRSVPGRLRVLQLFNGEIPAQGQRCVQCRSAMPLGKHEAVAVGQARDLCGSMCMAWKYNTASNSHRSTEPPM